MKTRRDFLATTGAGAAALLAGCHRASATYPGSIVGASSAIGHRLRDGTFPTPSETIETKVVIVGGGISGLAVARRLDHHGMREFLLLELEHEAGGNAASGRNAVSAYPWGAHYVPLPNEESTEVLALFEELGLTRGRGTNGAPIFDEESLCSDPLERLFDAGRWQEGLLPQIGITDADRRQYEAFFTRMVQFRDRRGSDGRPAFTIPLDLSSRDPELLALDRITMAEWLRTQHFDSVPLLWHVDYCCRDDYGAGIAHVSAWAGVHYFASRRGRAANADPDAVVTWPEGNGWLAHQLAAPLRERLRGGYVVFNIEQNGEDVFVDAFDLARERSVRHRARGVVCAAPRFVAQRIVRGLSPTSGLEYSPWMVANITVDTLPGGNGAALAWDNVARASASLGYVVATHQDITLVPQQSVLTHYWPLDVVDPRDARQQAIARTHREWCDLIVADLVQIHPGIEEHIQNIDVWLWGHGMIRPVPGFIWGEERARMLPPHGAVVFAHSDMSGISIFEEAFTRGTHAADSLLPLLA
ncbi:twin-arginine translocation pathway signal [Chthoniobacter flavus Ellin428]|uniref:Twin-arginine translocation pathway signal n=1 Tax=Chthoniobacter flavus Ellin428 TaxID=497964 RepID=B4D8G5_9BACT|nr:NAD(P)/FAD-dependent oxidoreductase [Chthoniobacter flavus]EDY17187.1 twin-arginine translocation pathway signal [Chthoniobacter flavus Ellin428]TCO86988.1 putative NAD(P)-binding protein [Chthoniobacter flavus]